MVQFILVHFSHQMCGAGGPQKKETWRHVEIIQNLECVLSTTISN